MCTTSIQPTHAQDARYRVELLLLRHLNGAEEAEPQQSLTDYSAALDLQPPIDETELEPGLADEADPEAQTDYEAAGENPPPGLTGPEGDPETEAPGTEESGEIDAEPQIVLLETQSEVMQRAWQRLKTSADYRPELYLSWEQPEVEPFPSIRVHDQKLLFEDDPYADLRAGIEEAEEQVPTFTDTMTPVETLTDENGEAAPPEDTLPAPTRFYRIDGRATLRKARFLHLQLDLEYREPLFSQDQQNEPMHTADPLDEQRPRPSAYLVHYLRQSRQVQTQSMEYFDGPVFAVLAMISRVEADPDQDNGEPLASRSLP